MASFGAFLPIFFSSPQEEEKDLKQIFNILTTSDFISKYTNYIFIYNTYQDTR